MKNVKAGITLVEILVVIGISAVAGMLLFSITVNSLGLFTSQSSRVEQGLNINDALGQIRSIIKQSSAVAPSFTSGSETYVSGVNQLVLKVPSLDSQGDIIPDIYDYFVLFLDNALLRFKSFPDALSSRQASNRVFSASADNLTVLYFNSANPPVEVAPIEAVKIRVVLTVKQKTGTTYMVSTATSEANLRND